MPIHGSLFDDFKETEGRDQFTRQSSKMLKVRMDYGPVLARIGSMVAYQGDVRFANKGSGGLSKLVKSSLTGEGVPVMECTGQGDLFLAEDAADIQVLYLENDMVSVNGANVLAFSASIDWDIHRVSARGGMMAGGLFNVSLRGSGYVAVTTKGEPVALEVSSAPTFGDAQAVVLWTQGVQMSVRTDTGGIGSMVRGGTGEMLQMAFSGRGHVLVQPAENAANTGSGERRSGGLSDFLG
ncbi:AIM24 family protein [Serinicoccus kebangsaanensis]|uniref:AIM24 family protein n=1 Tax=Serinicoccus kebangsaanensis TaxID=2602069 RepID=UPI00124E37C2|nr:AIM24 family protein [Serinicoccus kebangsaanensis]